MNLVGVQSSEIDGIWDDVKDRIADVLGRFSDDDYSLEDVYRQLISADAQLWTTTDKDAIYITQVLKKKSYQEVLVWMFHADELKEEHWELLEIIKMWAKQVGCTKVRVVVRPGFEKSLTKHGWKKRHVTMAQEI